MLSFFENERFGIRLNSNIVDDIKSVSNPYTIKDKYGILTTDAKTKHIYLVLEGVVRSYSVHQELEWTRWFFTKGDIALSIDGFLTNKNSEEFLQASSNTQIVAIEKYHYYNLLEKHDQLKLLTNHLIDDYFQRRSAYDYCMRFLSADERYVWFTRNYPYTLTRVQLKHLASFLGHTAQSLSRTRRKLQKK